MDAKVWLSLLEFFMTESQLGKGTILFSHALESIYPARSKTTLHVSEWHNLYVQFNLELTYRD